ncbi:MAG TPA: RNA polymerase sporulation sigma factor SigE [Candidatus Acidoferrum sp.]|nr:RNA polymerase sporulation sigma factor SigE [Candidatus Acidoferrum sp.]
MRREVKFKTALKRTLFLAVLRIRRLLGLGLPGAHYINGPDTLPPPLTREEEAELLSNLDGSGRSVRNKLIERNLRLVVYIARKYESTGIGIEDLVSIGTIGLIKAINTFKPERGIKLATYASRCIENEILMYIRKNQYTRFDVSIDEPLNVDWDGNELLLSDILGTDPDCTSQELEAREEREALLAAVAALGERERLIMEYRFGMRGPERTQKDVADLLGISQSYISRLEKKILVKLKNVVDSGP